VSGVGFSGPPFAFVVVNHNNNRPGTCQKVRTDDDDDDGCRRAGPKYRASEEMREER
jgi:hypothetical protein